MKTYEATIRLTGSTKLDIITINCNSAKEALLQANRYGEVSHVIDVKTNKMFI